MDQVNVLVTGGAGFIGSHVAQELLKSNYNVVVLDDLSGGFKRNIPNSATFIQGSILDEDLIDSLFEKHQFKFVFHLAAYAAEGLSHFIRKFNYTNNVIGSINLINAAIKYNVERFVFTSSIAVYGSGQVPFTEETSPKPEDPYGIAKYAVELDLEAAHQQFGLNYTLFRPHNVYGVGQNLSDPYRNVVGIFMRQILNNDPLTIYGNGLQTRAFTHIDAIKSTIANCIENSTSKNEIYNLGSDVKTSINELANLLLEITNSKNEVLHLESRNEVLEAISSHKKALEHFEDSASVSLKSGLKEVWRWANKLEIQPANSFKNIEIRKRLPKNWK